MKWSRVMLPVVFEEFKLVYIFLLFFPFTIIFNQQKIKFSKNLGGCSPPSPHTVSSKPLCHFLVDIIVTVFLAIINYSKEIVHDPGTA